MKKKLAVQIKALIDEDPSADSSLVLLTQVFHASKSKIMQQFKASYHISIHQYIVQQRLQKACVLLRETDEPIKVIAGKCGFPSEKHFMMLFKKHFLMSAGNYRNQYGEV
jgi:AraC-like DNA-binding protein